MSDEKNSIDLRSYFPRFERKMTWIDGEEYFIREIEDLSEAEFASMLEEEQRFPEMSLTERTTAMKAHLQMMLVVVADVRCSASPGERTLRLSGAVKNVKAGDVVFLSNGLYVDRNEIAGVQEDGDNLSISVVEAWRFGARPESSRLYRAIRKETLCDPNLTQKQLLFAEATAKTPPQKEDDGERPQKAASGSTSSTNSLP